MTEMAIALGGFFPSQRELFAPKRIEREEGKHHGQA